MSISVLDPLDSPLRGPWYRHCFLLFSLRFYFSQFIFEKSNLAYYLLFPKQTHFSALISIIFSNLSTKKSGLLPNPLQRKNMMLKWLYQKLSLRFFPAPFIRKKIKSYFILFKSIFLNRHTSQLPSPLFLAVFLPKIGSSHSLLMLQRKHDVKTSIPKMSFMMSQGGFHRQMYVTTDMQKQDKVETVFLENFQEFRNILKRFHAQNIASFVQSLYFYKICITSEIFGNSTCQNHGCLYAVTIFARFS